MNNKNMPPNRNGSRPAQRPKLRSESVCAPKDAKNRVASKMPIPPSRAKYELPADAKKKADELEKSSSVVDLPLKTSKSSLEKGCMRDALPTSPMKPATGAVGKQQNPKILKKAKSPLVARKRFFDRQLSKTSIRSPDMRRPLIRTRASSVPRTIEASVHSSQSSLHGDLRLHNANKTTQDAKAGRQRVLEANKMKVFEGTVKKLKDFQSDFMKKCETMKTVMSNKIGCTYKFVGMVINENCKLVVNDDDLLRLPKKLPSPTVSDLKESVRKAVGSGLNVLYDHLTKIKMAKDELECSMSIEETRENLQILQNEVISELLLEVDDMCKTAEAGGDAEKSRVLLENTRKEYKQLELKLSELRKCHAKELVKMSQDSKNLLTTEIEKRDDLISKLTKEIENNKEYVQNMDTLLKDNQQQSESAKLKIAKLNEENQQLQERICKLTEENRQYCENAEFFDVHTDEMNNLKIELSKARELIIELKEKEEICKSNHNLEPPYNVMVSNLHKRIDSLETIKKTFEIQMPKLLNDSEKLKSYEKAILELSAKIKQLSKTNDEKSTALDALKLDLEKSQSVVARLEQQVEHNLQVNTELITKSEEFRNLFNTLGTKQAEITRQAHVIKLLEDNVERTHLLRVKQEEKVSVMEEEISQLKKTMSFHRRIIAINRCRNLFEPLLGDMAKGGDDEDDKDQSSRKKSRKNLVKTNRISHQRSSDECLVNDQRRRGSTISVKQILT